MSIIRKIKSKVYRGYYSIFLECFYRVKTSVIKNNWKPDNDSRFEYMREFVNNNYGTDYHIELVSIPQSTAKHKWVGAQILNDNIIAIPNDEQNILVLDKEWKYLGKTKGGLFKWTGGCVWNNSVFCFPRTESSFLRINDNSIEEVPLEYSYGFEHHYGGVCTSEGVVYQPPRNTSHILKTDLKTRKSKKITIINEIFHVKLNYSGSIIHPNGYIYFFPVINNKVIKLNPKTDEWCYIGERITTFCFDAKIAVDGNIYGYNNNNNNGIFKIDVLNDKVEIIHQELKPGSYGTKYGIDGCLYNIPGDGDIIYRFNPMDDTITVVDKLDSKLEAKFAGGVTMKDGTIMGIPAEESVIIKYVPNHQVLIPDDLYNMFFIDNY